MNDLQQLQQAKEQCIADLSGALPRYRERLDAADSRLALYIEDALSNHASQQTADPEGSAQTGGDTGGNTQGGGSQDTGGGLEP